MDALFGLCRKKSAGSSVQPPLNGTLIFASRSEVDKFIEKYNRQRCKQSLDSVRGLISGYHALKL